MVKALQVIRDEGVKGFMTRWKQGIADSSALQQSQAMLLFNWIMAIGMLIGFVVMILQWKSMWWVAIILGMAFANTFIGIIALKQKIKILKQLEGGLTNEETMQQEVPL